MTDKITDEQKREIKQFVEAQSDQWTDFVSMLDETLHLYQKPVKQRSAPTQKEIEQS